MNIGKIIEQGERDDDEVTPLGDLIPVPAPPVEDVPEVHRVPTDPAHDGRVTWTN